MTCPGAAAEAGLRHTPVQQACGISTVFPGSSLVNNQYSYSPYSCTQSLFDGPWYYYVNVTSCPTLPQNVSLGNTFNTSTVTITNTGASAGVDYAVTAWSIDGQLIYQGCSGTLEPGNAPVTCFFPTSPCRLQGGLWWQDAYVARVQIKDPNVLSSASALVEITQTCSGTGAAAGPDLCSDGVVWAFEYPSPGNPTQFATGGCVTNLTPNVTCSGGHYHCCPNGQPPTTQQPCGTDSWIGNVNCWDCTCGC